MENTHIIKKEKKNFAIITELLRKAGSLTKTKLVKMLFLIDLDYYNKKKKKLSNFTYIRYFYGPYPKEIETILSYLNALGIITYETRLSSAGKTYYLISINTNDRVKKLGLQDSLNTEEKFIIEKIAKDYSTKNLDDILKQVYELDEVKNKPFGETIL